jgi:hypothetical protein
MVAAVTVAAAVATAAGLRRFPVTRVDVAALAAALG